MADLTIQSDGEIVTAIYKAYERRNAAEVPRNYLGGSIIGKECNRALWYDLRWATKPSFSGRLLRLFDTGHREEPRMVQDLRDIGVELFERDPKTGKQFSYSDMAGHFRGNLDGVAKSVPGGGRQPYVVEFKTHSNKSFNDLKKQGVEKSKPMHYAQMQVYMGWSKMDRALYLAKNKDTDELYCERIAFDVALYERLRAKASSIIFSDLPPQRLTDDPAFFICKMCDHNQVCHGNRVPQKSCRTCVHLTPQSTGDGIWKCKRYDLEPTHAQQLTGCDDHLPLPPLLQYAETIDSGDDWILFRHTKTGKHFVVTTEHGMPPAELTLQHDQPPRYTSAEIAAAEAGAITNPEIDALRTEFKATITG